jgi:hypothetical protein
VGKKELIDKTRLGKAEAWEELIKLFGKRSLTGGG